MQWSVVSGEGRVSEWELLVYTPVVFVRAIIYLTQEHEPVQDVPRKEVR